MLDIRGGNLKENMPIIQYDRKLTADAHNQQFGYSKDGHIYVLVEPHMVLDIRGAAVEDGSRVILYHKKPPIDGDNLNQLWDLIPAGQVRKEREVLFEADF